MACNKALHILKHFDGVAELRRNITEWVKIENIDWQRWLDAALLLLESSSHSNISGMFINDVSSTSHI
jgi:hypothetical protein